MPHTLLPCDLTLADLTAALSTGVATVSSLAQLRVRDAKQQRQCRHIADREWKLQKQAVTRDAYRAANQLRITARRTLELIRLVKGLADFIDMKHQTCFRVAMRFLREKVLVDAKEE